MSGLEKILFPKKKDPPEKGVKGLVKKFLLLTDYAIPYNYVTDRLSYSKYLDIDVEFSDYERLMIGEYQIEKAFEPLGEDGKYWSPRILYYNFLAVDDLTRLEKALEITKDIVKKTGLTIVNVKMKNPVSAVLFNYILWRLGLDPEYAVEVKCEMPEKYKTIATSTELRKVWEVLERKYPGFIIVPGYWDEEGDNTVYAEGDGRYVYVKLPMCHKDGLNSLCKLVSIVIDKLNNKVALFNSNYGAIVYYALSQNPYKLQHYIKEYQPTTVKAVYPAGAKFYINIITDTDQAYEDFKEYLDPKTDEFARNSESLIIIIDKVFDNDGLLQWLDFKYQGSNDYLVRGGETKFMKGITEGDKGDWYSNLIHFLDKALDWGVSAVLAKDTFEDTEGYAPTRDEYLEDFLEALDEEEIEYLREEGYDI